MKSQPQHAWREPFLVFLKLGLTSFGGPIAHLGYLRAEIVARRQWVSEAAYADLVALCQFLPGPASSQVGLALGYLRAGLRGALGAWLGFTLPSALLMIACAYGLSHVASDSSWLHGLKIAAVAVVGQAVWSMGVKLCPDGPRIALALAAAALALWQRSAWSQVALIAAGLTLGWRWFRAGIDRPATDAAFESPSVRQGAFARANLVLFLVLLAGLPILGWLTGSRGIHLTEGFYRTGALVFGGGHVILPLLETETVGRGLLTRDAFLAGYGAAQALPGPLFTFAAYLGTVIAPFRPAWLAGLGCLVAIFLPSLLLVFGVLPFWARLRARPEAQAALRGANAVVVGILLAAFYDPVWTSAIDSARALALAVTAFALLQFARLPPWALVLLCAAGSPLLLT